MEDRSGCGVHAGPAKVRTPVLQRSRPGASRHPALRLVGQPRAALERPLSVLLVDDVHHHRSPLVGALRDQGHSVLYAADGASGETICRASQLEIDALVTRADMKRMCGSELARRVVRMRPGVRVLLMWRHFEEPEEAQRAYERGYPMIQEPFSPEELCRRLTGLLASPSIDACAEPRLDAEDRLVRREDGLLAIGSGKEN